MINWIRKLLGLDTIDLLKKYAESLKKELDELKSNPICYTTLSIPTVEGLGSLNDMLSSLGKNEKFWFYLMTLENEQLAMFRDGKGADIYRGGLRTIQKIKKDVTDAGITLEGIKTYE